MKTKILIIEDNERNLYMQRFLLEKHGFEVVGARDGREGLEAASRERPALIVLDIQLPVMDGHEVARRLKEQPETRDIPIVVVTSYAMPKDREMAFASGCDGYIEKPIDPESFASQVERYLPTSLPHGSDES